jgi:tRNA A37 threonylcarbamoyladenosine modification protein TsaB
MAILGFSLSTGFCQLAWHHHGEFKEQVTALEHGQTHAGFLVPLIKDFLPMPPTVVATTTGPGSFTSIRIQLATGIGLKIGYSAQLFCPNTLDLLQWAFNGAIPVIDSFRGDYFAKINDTVTCITVQELDVLKEQGKTICGDIGQTPQNIATNLIQYYLSHPDAERLKNPEPYYVRTPEYKTRANISR